MKEFIKSASSLSALLAFGLFCAPNPAAAQVSSKRLGSIQARASTQTPQKHTQGVGDRIAGRLSPRYRALGKSSSGRILRGASPSLVKLTNDCRAQNGVPALQGSSVLNMVAT